MTYILHHVNHESSAALSVHPDVESAIHAVGDRVAAYDEWDDRIHVDEGKDQDIADYGSGGVDVGRSESGRVWKVVRGSPITKGQPRGLVPDEAAASPIAQSHHCERGPYAPGPGDAGSPVRVWCEGGDRHRAR